jgi:hypothetical protein
MYSSARQGVPATAKLHVLFTGQHVSGVVQALDVAHDYIADLGKTEAGIIVHTVVSNINTTNSSYAKIVSLDVQDHSALLRYASENNIDVIHDSEGVFTKKERFTHRESFVITNTLPELTVQLESYLTGNEIAWNFANPTWHINWIYKYSMQSGISSIAFGFIGTAQEKKYTPKQMEFVRALANKTMHI